MINTKQNPNPKKINYKQYDLEERCLNFAKRTRQYIKLLPRTITNTEYGKQLARSSASIGANYIEANESMSKRDFCMRAKISKKEAKESRYWFLLSEPLEKYEKEKEWLIDEVTQLMKIIGAILEKSK